jgi:hypothetical protein
MINYRRESVRAYQRSMERLPREDLANVKWVHRVSTLRGFVPTSTDQLLALKMRAEGCYLLRCREVLFLSCQRRMALANEVRGERERLRERREREKDAHAHPHSLTHNLRIDTLALAMRSETQTKEEGEGMGGQGRAAEVTDRRLFSFWLHT